MDNTQPTTPQATPNQAASTPPVTLVNDVMPPVSTPVSTPAPSAVSPIPAEHIETVVPSATTAVSQKRSPMLVIVTIVVLIVLGLGAAAYLATSKKTLKVTVAPTSQSSKSSGSVTAKDPSATATSIDGTMTKLDDAKDYSATGINDTTLGL